MTANVAIVGSFSRMAVINCQSSDLTVIRQFCEIFVEARKFLLEDTKYTSYKPIIWCVDGKGITNVGLQTVS